MLIEPIEYWIVVCSATKNYIKRKLNIINNITQVVIYARLRRAVALNCGSQNYESQSQHSFFFSQTKLFFRPKPRIDFVQLDDDDDEDFDVALLIEKNS